MKACFLVIAFILPFAIFPVANADSVDAHWSVVGFTGEAWFINPQEVIGSTQRIHRGRSEGDLFNCNAAGQSATYTRYDNDAFFDNPEFERFIALRDEMTLNSKSLFVHRVTCEGGGNPSNRQVLYPFVTNEARVSAWYLFEGGVFTLYNPGI